MSASPAIAQDAPLKGRETFEIDGHTAFVYAAPKPAEGRPWLWHAPTIKGVSIVQRKVYFDSLGGEGDPTGPLAEAIARDFGSLARWKTEFAAMGRALGGGSGQRGGAWR